MTIRLYGCVCGHLNSAAAALGVTGPRIRAPMPFYVIEHPEGVALFDCGLPAGLTQADDPYRQALQGQDMLVELDEAELTAARLQALDIDPERVRWVVLSHLHFDHAGGLHQVPNATLVVQTREWAAGFDEQLAARYFLPKMYFDLGHKVMQVDGEHDLFGDGSVVTIPSFGHTPGHQSLRVRSREGDHILTGDACYFCQVVESRQFPAFSDAAAMNRSLDALLALREPETVLVFGHDPEQWGATPVLPTARA